MKNKNWQIIQISTLGLAGLLALLVGIARTPSLEALLPKSYFQTALVGHVDLFLVVWYLIIPILFLKDKKLLTEKSEKMTVALLGLGTLGIVIPSVFALGQPVMANYVPFIINPIFVGGFFLLMGGLGVAALSVRKLVPQHESPFQGAIGAAAFCYLLTAVSIVLFGFKLLIEGQELFSQTSLTRMFWFSGHLLQFGHVGFMLLIWGEFLFISGVPSEKLQPMNRFLQQLPLGVFAGIGCLFFRTTEELLTTRLITDLKSYGVGIPTAIVAAYTIWLMISFSKKRQGNPYQNATLYSALALLALGGAIALTANMQVQTTLIPAHYHAVLTAVGVTFMGYTYYLLEKEGVQISSPRFRTLQPYLYGFGTFALAAGMAWAGLHNAPRKTPGMSYLQSDDINLKISLYLWGAGVLISVVGGFAYLINTSLTCYRWRKEK